MTKQKSIERSVITFYLTKKKDESLNQLEELKTLGFIERIGSNKTGYWKIKK